MGDLFVFLFTMKYIKMLHFNFNIRHWQYDLIFEFHLTEIETHKCNILYLEEKNQFS